MPYNISWSIEQRIMLIEVSGNITLEEFKQMHDESFTYLVQSPHKVHAIADLNQFEAIPTNIRMLFSATNKEKHPNQGMTVLVMPKMSGIIRFVASLIMQTLRLEYRVCENIDDALKILQRIDVDVKIPQAMSE